MLCELGRVEHLDELGTNGPLLASAGADSLFHCLFGRDAIRMAMDLLDDFPTVAHSTLFELARLQGVTHNLRGAYCARHGSAILDEPITDRLWRSVTVRDTLLSALAWIVSRMDDPIAGGYLWVRRAASHGIVNQVWEDSHDSYYHADGALLDPARPYAPVAVQGYVYDALMTAAGLLTASPGELPLDPAWLRNRAARLRRQVLSEFWLDDLGTFAQALAVDDDGGRRPARVIASSAGHLLDGMILAGEDAAAQRTALMRRFACADMVSGA